jgi:outer membrane receptor for ferrienterochelin and colicins
MIVLRLITCLFTIFFAVASFVQAQEGQKLQEIVVTSTMTEKNIEEAPGSIEVISEQELIEMNAETVADALEGATSLLVIDAEGKQKAPRIRGTDPVHSLVLVDGRRLPPGFKGLVDLEVIPVDMIARIEVLRGPASALYGADALGGVINIITKRPPEQLSMGVTGQYGQRTYSDQQDVRGRAYIGNSWDRFGFLLAGGLQEKDGYDRDGVSPNDGDEIFLKSIAGRFSFDINDTHGLLAGFEHVHKNDVGTRFMQNLDREWDHVDQRTNYFVQYDGTLSSLFKLMLRANRSDQKNDTTLTPPSTGTTADAADKTDLDQFEARLTGIIGPHMLTLGTDYSDSGLEESSGVEHGVKNLSFYAQDEYQIFEPLYLVLGIRFDDHSEFGSEWTPRTSLIYSIFDNLRLKASYGMGFRAPSLTELFIASNRSQGKTIYEPNPALDPETSRSYEVGVEGEYKRFQGRLTCFRNEIDDLIDAVWYKASGSGNKKVDYYQYQNIAEATISGIEFEWGLGLPHGFSLSGNLAYLDTEDENTGLELEGRPDYKASLKLGYNHQPSGINTNVRVNYIGERYYASGNEDNLTLVNCYLSKKLSEKVKLFTGVDNIFNSGENEGKEPTLFYGGVSLTY